jgi:hypothetical protein
MFWSGSLAGSCRFERGSRERLGRWIEWRAIEQLCRGTHRSLISVTPFVTSRYAIRLRNVLRRLSVAGVRLLQRTGVNYTLTVTVRGFERELALPLAPYCC